MFTFRLADALPQRLLDRWQRELEGLDKRDADIERYRRIEGWLDAGHGACFLNDPRLAALTEQAILHFHKKRYHVRAWCVMPNHVHILIDMHPGYPLPAVVWSWKSWTARHANALLGRSGQFWQREYFDRFIRDCRHLADVIAYIENNPVKAGLVATPSDWPWSSARFRSDVA
jgi:REP element-mobilizing transposase RayT